MKSVEEGKEYVLQQTLTFQRVLQRAIELLQRQNKKELSLCDILVSIISENNSDAQHFLLNEGVTKEDLEAYAVQYHSKHKKSTIEDQKSKIDSYLKIYTTDLIQKAALGKIDNLVGREKEEERVIRTLLRRRKNNPILVGEVGVGKTAIIEGIALKIYENKIDSNLNIKNIFSLNLNKLIAGTKMRGELESRVGRLFKILEEKQDAVLFIDEIHTIIGAGSTNSSSMDISNILKPLLSENKIRCIGATNFNELKTLEKDSGFIRRFEKIEVQETTIPETIEILNGLKHYYENHHSVKYSQNVIESVANLSAKYINDAFLPDKAIDVVDEVGSYINFNKKQSNYKITINDVEKIVATIAKVPMESVSVSDKNLLLNLDKKLLKKIFGQDEAINVVTKAIKRARAGLVNYERPVGSFIFSGPTGVGKTELARQLAIELGVNFIRFDMSEYMEKHSVSRLIGSPPGYVGYERGGILTDKIRRNPYSVILFDEIEKAHPDIYNILLQIMDYGTLTDNKGVKANLNNAIIIMSSNVGAKNMIKNDIGFIEAGGKNIKMKGKKALERLFSPEFINRIDENVVFNQLDIKVMEKIVDKFIFEIKEQCKVKKIELKLTNDARKWLAQKGFDVKYGARPLKRLVQTEVKDNISDYILFKQKSLKNKVITIGVKKDNLYFN